MRERIKYIYGCYLVLLLYYVVTQNCNDKIWRKRYILRHFMSDILFVGDYLATFSAYTFIFVACDGLLFFWRLTTVFSLIEL